MSLISKRSGLELRRAIALARVSRTRFFDLAQSLPIPVVNDDVVHAIAGPISTALIEIFGSELALITTLIEPRRRAVIYCSVAEILRADRLPFFDGRPRHAIKKDQFIETAFAGKLEAILAAAHLKTPPDGYLATVSNLGPFGRSLAAYHALWQLLEHDGFASRLPERARRGQLSDETLVVASRMLRHKEGAVPAARILLATERFATVPDFENWETHYRRFRSPRFQAADLETLAMAAGKPKVTCPADISALSSTY